MLVFQDTGQKSALRCGHSCKALLWEELHVVNIGIHIAVRTLLPLAGGGPADEPMHTVHSFIEVKGEM